MQFLYERLFNSFSLGWYVSRKSFQKIHLYIKLTCLTLIKLTTSVYFINILWAPFLYKSALLNFSLNTVGLCKFLWKNIGTKAAYKIFMKLTTEVFNQHFLVIHLYKQDEKLFMVKWHLANSRKNWQKCFNLSLKIGVLFVGQIDQWIFHAPATFCLTKKVW